MNLTTNFKAGQPVRAKDWNRIAREVNRIWAMEAGPGLTLVKGEQWRIGGYTGTVTAWQPVDGPVWEIYVHRESAVGDWDIGAAPSAVFLSGPFRNMASNPAGYIARLKRATGGGTTLDTAWTNAFSFAEHESGYYRQYLSKCAADGSLLISAGGGFLDNDSERGLWWKVNERTGEKLANPWADAEAVVPGIQGISVSGIASYGDTIASSHGILESDTGLMLFDSDGNPVEVSAGQYLWNSPSVASHFYVIAGASGYLYEATASVGGEPGIHKVEATAAGGIVTDATWAANGGDGTIGGTTLALRPILFSGEAEVCLGLYEWDNGIPFPPGSPGTLNFTGASRGSDFYLFPWETMVGTNVNAYPLTTWPAPSVGLVCIGIGNAAWEGLVWIGNGTSYTLAEFDAAVYDVKFFRTKDDGVTHQFIVVGDFTTYVTDGLPAQYIIFIDQDGNRLTDLEWP